MCFTYLFYYPAIDGFHCTQHGEFSPCEGGMYYIYNYWKKNLSFKSKD